MPVPTLRPPPLALEVHPLALLHPEGRFEALGPSFPPRGALLLVLWRPGASPAFRFARGRLLAGWRWEGDAPEEGWVVAWLAVEDPPQPF